MVFSFYLAREEYLVIRGSLDSNSALICPTTSCKSQCIRRLSAPPAIKALYSDSLLEAPKPKRTACSIFSSVGEVN